MKRISKNTHVNILCCNDEKRIIVKYGDAIRICNIKWLRVGTHIVEKNGLQIGRVITGVCAGRKLSVHHINGNPFDNRRENMEVMSNELHVHGHHRKKNYSGVRKHRRKYYGRLQRKGMCLDISFKTKDEAARFVDWANIITLGPLATMNSPKHICSALAAYMIMQSREEIFVLLERRNGHELRAMHCKYEKMDEESMGKLLRNQLLPVTLSASEGVNPNDSTLGCIPIENIRQLKIAGNIYRVSEI
jgi:hypothetical protein